MPDQSFSEYSQRGWAPFIWGTIISRVLFLCVSVGLLPLLFYIALSWRTEAWIETQNVLQELQRIDQQSNLLIKVWMKERSRELEKLYGEQKLSRFDSLSDTGAFFSMDLQSVAAKGFWQKHKDFKEPVGGVFLEAGVAQLIFVFFSSERNVWLGERLLVEEWFKELLLQEVLLKEAKVFLVEQGEQAVYPMALQEELKSIDFSFSLHDHLSWVFFPYEYQYVGSKIPLPGSSCSLVFALPPPNLGMLRIKKLLLKNFLLFFLGGGVGFFVILFFLRRIGRPLRLFFQVMQKVAHGNLEERYIDDPWGGEFNLLGKYFNNMLTKLLGHMEEIRRGEVRQELLSQELCLGRKIQETLLPHNFVHFGGVDIASVFLPAKELSGDFYDLFQLNEDLLAICIGDGSDKGISACLYSLIVRTMLRHALRERPVESYGEVLLRVNKLFCEDAQESGNFVTLGVGIFDKRSYQMTFFSMGHCPPLFIPFHSPESQVSFVQESAIGVEREEVPSGSHVQLQPGDIFFLYTDGLSEVEGRSGHFFDVEHMKRVLIREKEKEPQEMVGALCQEALRTSPGALFSDDVTMLLLKVQKEDCLRACDGIKDLSQI